MKNFTIPTTIPADHREILQAEIASLTDFHGPKAENLRKAIEACGKASDPNASPTIKLVYTQLMEQHFNLCCIYIRYRTPEALAAVDEDIQQMERLLQEMHEIAKQCEEEERYIISLAQRTVVGSMSLH